MINLKIELKLIINIIHISIMNSSTNTLHSNKVIKNCPVFNGNESEELKKANFDWTQKFYPQFQNFMFQNPGKTSQELCKLINFYNFTEESLEIAFKLFNTRKNTYYGVCGPFIYKNERWFPVYSKKYTDTVLLAEENSRLREKIAELEKKIAAMSSGK